MRHAIAPRFIGRGAELGALERRYSSNRSELIPVLLSAHRRGDFRVISARLARAIRVR